MLHFRETKFSDLKNKSVIDITGQKIGRVIDLLFSFAEGKVQLKTFVLGGSRIQEFLESLSVRPDIDPVFPIDMINRVEDDKLFLNIEYKKLGEPVKPGKKEMRLSDLSDIQIRDVDGKKIGKIEDVWFDESGSIWFIVGGGFFEELLETLRIQPNIDLLVPQDIVKSISPNEIKIKVTKDQLKTTAKMVYEEIQHEIMDHRFFALR